VGSGSRRGDYDMALHTDEGPGDGLVQAALYGYLVSMCKRPVEAGLRDNAGATPCPR
jgi:hypothetical protein